MEELLKRIEIIEDSRQQSKVRHQLVDIVVIVLISNVSKCGRMGEDGRFCAKS